MNGVKGSYKRNDSSGELEAALNKYIFYLNKGVEILFYNVSCVTYP